MTHDHTHDHAGHGRAEHGHAGHSHAGHGHTPASFGRAFAIGTALNVGFVVGDISDIRLHNVYELFAALVVSLLATVMKFGDRSPLGSTLLATSLVADLQLAAAAAAWGYYAQQSSAPLSPHECATMVSLAIGASIANLVSVVLLIVEMAGIRR